VQRRAPLHRLTVQEPAPLHRLPVLSGPETTILLRRLPETI
jgi:hypothetical protein